MPKGQPGTKAPRGTPARYNDHACRCAECREASRQYQHRLGYSIPREVYDAEREPPHGTESRYTSRVWCCRCEACRAAANEARRQRNAANPEHARAMWREYKRRRRQAG